jgi:hypothetical protein
MVSLIVFAIVIILIVAIIVEITQSPLTHECIGPRLVVA